MMKGHDLENLATILKESGQYEVSKRYQRPEYYRQGDNRCKHIGAFLDVETTGLSYVDDKIIELGIVKFEYTEDGSIFRVLDEFSSYQDPCRPIPSHITKLTDNMVQGKHINEIELVRYLQDVELIIAHNAKFDNLFFNKAFQSLSPKAWACSMIDVNWRDEGISSHKLEYIAYKYNFFYEGHRAVTDCLAGIHILAQELPNSKQPVLKQLLTNSQRLRFKLWATHSGYESKDLLKARGYKWNDGQDGKYKAWFTELTEDYIADEIAYLRSEIYNGCIHIPIEILDSYNRFSSRSNDSDNSTKYQDKIKQVRKLCLE